ncbi:FUSC family protein [Legionella fairfieldensis]|uniref:FUSC family protein n=1 Tax=Legionella fairfieldensis TaxID=45064 RepID=UPI00048ABCD7|nr:FUSC family protein [Legionella fairfieldensis]
MPLRNTTKMAWQAVIAIFIAEFMSAYLHLERGYWTTLATMALITQTWGESIRRSFERVTMTILGGVCGTVLYFILPANEIVMLGLLFIFVFFTVYMLQINYLVSVFMLTGYVVLLFALMGDWTLALLKDRIVDTALGAGIALFVGCFFLPIKTDIANLFINHLEKMLATLTLVFSNKPQANRTTLTSQHLYTDFQMIRKNALSIRYEMLFHRMNRRDFYLLLTQTAFCTQYVASLIESYRWLESYLTQEDRAGITTAMNITRHNFETMIKRLKNEPHSAMLPAAELHTLIAEKINQDPQRFATLENEALSFFNVMYFFIRLNTRMNESYTLLD